MPTCKKEGNVWLRVVGVSLSQGTLKLTLALTPRHQKSILSLSLVTGPSEAPSHCQPLFNRDRRLRSILLRVRTPTRPGQHTSQGKKRQAPLRTSGNRPQKKLTSSKERERGLGKDQWKKVKTRAVYRLYTQNKHEGQNSIMVSMTNLGY